MDVLMIPKEDFGRLCANAPAFAEFQQRVRKASSDQGAPPREKTSMVGTVVTCWRST